jgi:hypothetical protein
VGARLSVGGKKEMKKSRKGFNEIDPFLYGALGERHSARSVL